MEYILGLVFLYIVYLIFLKPFVDVKREINQDRMKDKILHVYNTDLDKLTRDYISKVKEEIAYNNDNEKAVVEFALNFFFRFSYETGAIKKADFVEEKKINKIIKYLWKRIKENNEVFPFYTEYLKEIDFWQKGIHKDLKAFEIDEFKMILNRLNTL